MQERQIGMGVHVNEARTKTPFALFAVNDFRTGLLRLLELVGRYGRMPFSYISDVAVFDENARDISWSDSRTIEDSGIEKQDIVLLGDRSRNGHFRDVYDTAVYIFMTPPKAGDDLYVDMASVPECGHG